MEKKKFELDQDAVKAIADEAAKSIDVTSIVKEAISTYQKEKEEIEKKDIEDKDGDAQIKITDAIDKLPKEVRFARAVMAMQGGDRKALKELNSRAVEARRKTGYGNETTSADGGYVITDPEFEAEVEKLAPVYGVALQEANIRRISSNSVKTNKRGSNVTMYEVTTEGGQKQGTKMTFGQSEVTLREFAAIAAATNNLVEDAAIDFWGEVTEGFAEEYARLADQLVFTDTNATYPGIINTDGVGVESVGASISSLTWDDLLDAEAEIPTVARKNMKHYMHRTVWNILTKVKASGNGMYQFTPNTNGQLSTPWGTPVVLSDSLPNSAVVGDANEGYIVVGDLQRAKLYIKRGLILEMSKEATVHDSEGNSINLWEKNMQALKAEVRMVNLVKFPEAFNVIGTGTVS